jgi:hypothetical protein
LAADGTLVDGTAGSRPRLRRWTAAVNREIKIGA